MTRGPWKHGVVAFGLAALLATGARPAAADGFWPTEGTVLDGGMPIAPEALAALVEGRTVILDYGGYAAGAGVMLECARAPGRVMFYDGVLAIEAEDDMGCRVDGSRICVGRPDEEACADILTLPGAAGAFSSWGVPEVDDYFTSENLAEFRSLPATRIAAVDIPIDQLLAPEGPLDFGFLSLTLPAGRDMALLGASTFPLTLLLGGEAGLDDIFVLVEIAGWPDTRDIPGPAREIGPGDDAQMRDDLAAAAERMTGDPVREGAYGESYVVEDHGLNWITEPDGACFRLEQNIDVLSDPERIEILPGPTRIFHQACISPDWGLLLRVIVSLSEPADADDPARFRSDAATMLDSIRLGPAAE